MLSRLEVGGSQGSLASWGQGAAEASRGVNPAFKGPRGTWNQTWAGHTLDKCLTTELYPGP